MGMLSYKIWLLMTYCTFFLWNAINWCLLFSYKGNALHQSCHLKKVSVEPWCWRSGVDTKRSPFNCNASITNAFIENVSLTLALLHVHLGGGLYLMCPSDFVLAGPAHGWNGGYWTCSRGTEGSAGGAEIRIWGAVPSSTETRPPFVSLHSWRSRPHTTDCSVWSAWRKIHGHH